MASFLTEATRRAIFILLGDDTAAAFASATPYAICTENNYALDTEDGVSIDIEHPDAPTAP